MSDQPTSKQPTSTQATATYAVSEIVGTSPVGIAEAIENAIATASRTLKHLGWFEVVSIRGALEGGNPQYQVTIKLGFRYVEDDD